jgi:hypothetical protein
MYGKHVGTYESCSTSAFKHGRTETVRSCTTATSTVCEKLYGKGGRQASSTELIEDLRKCSEVHGQLTKEAALGNIEIWSWFFCLHICSILFSFWGYINEIRKRIILGGKCYEQYKLKSWKMHTLVTIIVLIKKTLDWWYSRYHSKHHSADTPQSIVTDTLSQLFAVRHSEKLK